MAGTPVLVGLALVIGACGLSRRLRLGVERELAVAALRGLVQLGAITLVLRAVFDHLGLSALFVAVMARASAAAPPERVRNRRRLVLVASKRSTALVISSIGPPWMPSQHAWPRCGNRVSKAP